MGAGIARAATMRLPIEDAWLDECGKSKYKAGEHYWDWDEILNYTGEVGDTTCTYFNELIRQGWYNREECHAYSGMLHNIVPNGMHVSDCDSGNDVRGYLWDEPIGCAMLEYRIDPATGKKIRRSDELVDQIEHPRTYRRIYARGTTARGISILCLPSQ